MNTKLFYNTVSHAVDELRKAGFTKDFSFGKDYILSNKTKIDIDDLRIVKVFRYEGNSDPADEASVYGLESSSGVKGILIAGEDTDSAPSARHILKKLHSEFLSSMVI